MTTAPTHTCIHANLNPRTHATDTVRHLQLKIAQRVGPHLPCPDRWMHPHCLHPDHLTGLRTTAGEQLPPCGTEMSFGQLGGSCIGTYSYIAFQAEPGFGTEMSLEQLDSTCISTSSCITACFLGHHPGHPLQKLNRHLHYQIRGHVPHASSHRPPALASTTSATTVPVGIAHNVPSGDTASTHVVSNPVIGLTTLVYTTRPPHSSSSTQSWTHNGTASHHPFSGCTWSC
jgi:hypothetical protein